MHVVYFDGMLQVHWFWQTVEEAGSYWQAVKKKNHHISFMWTIYVKHSTTQKVPLSSVTNLLHFLWLLHKLKPDCGSLGKKVALAVTQEIQLWYSCRRMISKPAGFYQLDEIMMHALFPVNQLCPSRQFESYVEMVDSASGYENLYLEKQWESKYMEWLWQNKLWS